ncbi:MAG: cupin domain-containing protein [Shewanella sp.]
MLSNVFKDLPEDVAAEVFERLAGNASVTIERIVSHGHSTPEGQWYDQAQHEFVMLLKGEATLVFEPQVSVRLTPGDYLTILPHQKHRVASTAAEGETLWLTVFYD